MVCAADGIVLLCDVGDKLAPLALALAPLALTLAPLALALAPPPRPWVGNFLDG